MENNIYANFAETYHQAGYEPVPIKRGEKRPANLKWGSHAPDLSPPSHINELLEQHGKCGIGLAAGVKLPNGNLFGAVDVDMKGFVPFIKAVLRTPICGKVGMKGATFFCQVEPSLKSKKFRGKGREHHAAELMLHNGMLVIPPTLHPDTGEPYRWLGKPLLELESYEALPVLSQIQFEIIRIVSSNENAWSIVEGGAGVKAHDLMLALTSSGIANLTGDLQWLADCLNSLFNESYGGDTPEKTLGMLHTAKEKGLGASKIRGSGGYEAGDDGPIPCGYLEDGRYAFFDQRRKIMVFENSRQLVQQGTLLDMASLSFWLAQFGSVKSGGQTLDALRAGDALIQACKEKGGFEVSLVRGRGVYRDRDGKIIVNWGGELPQDGRHIYVCHRPLDVPVDGKPADPEKTLELFRLFNWSHTSEPYLLLGWAALAPVCGALEWRPHVFINGPKNSGKTTLIHAITSLLDPIGLTLDGSSTEAGIRQKLKADSRPVVLDEFESDQKRDRLGAVIKLARSASSSESAIARGTPEGKALEFCIRSCFLFGAINVYTVTAADRSRIVNLSLKKHGNEKAVSRRIAELGEALEGTGPAWCHLTIARLPRMLQAIRMTVAAYPSSESRHAKNMSALLGAAWTMLNDREMVEADAEALLAEHAGLLESLEVAHHEDDAAECLNALLHYKLRDGVTLGMVMATITKNKDPKFDTGGLEQKLVACGIRREAGGFILAKNHRGLDEAFADTRWAGGAWKGAIMRLPGVEQREPKRFDGVRHYGAFVPDGYVEGEGLPEGLPLMLGF